MTEEEISNFRNNILHNEIEKAFKLTHILAANGNLSFILGENYVSSCQDLKNFRRNFVTKYYGSDSPCSYNQIIEALKSKKTCENALKKGSRINFAPSV